MINFGIYDCRKKLERWAWHVARMGEERGVYRVLVGKPEGKRPLGRPRRRWVDNIRMDLQEVGCGYMDWKRGLIIHCSFLVFNFMSAARRPNFPPVSRSI